MRPIFASSRPSLKLGTASKSGGRTALHTLPGAEGAVEVDGGAYEGEVGEGLGEVAQGLSARPDLLGVEPEVVGVGEHLLQGEAGFVETTGLRQALDEPEGADAEAPFFVAEAIRCSFSDLVAIHERVVGQFLL